MQANRNTVTRHAPWRIALDALRRAWGSAARTRKHSACDAPSSDAMPVAATDAPPSQDAPRRNRASDIDAPASGQSAQSTPQPSGERPVVQNAQYGPSVDRHALALGTALAAVDFLAQLDDALRIQSVSDASIEFIGYHRDYLSMLTLHDLVQTEDAGALNALIARARTSGKLESATLTVVKSLTYPICVELRLMSTAALGRPGFAVAAFDVTHWREREQALEHALNHDALTGLDNAAALEAAVTVEQLAAEHTRTQTALVRVDLDDYRRINRALGYDAGDELLRETAWRIQHTVGRDERVARIACDEFAVLLPAGTTADAAENVGRRVLTAIAQPYRHRGQHTHLSASVGVALYPDAAAGEKIGQGKRGVQASLLRMADHALAQAKLAGGNTLVFHTQDDNPADAERLKLETDLYEAVRNGEFSLYFQPITKIDTGAVVGVEALMRWNHPVHGLVPPSTFVPLAESIGLINYLGNWVLKASCMQLMQWDALGIKLDYVSVNVSPQQFRDKRFIAAVKEALALTGIASERLVFEITESLLMQDQEEATRLLEEIASIGIRFAVDDFGTGYSSLAYLQRFPLSKLKIDRSFVVNLITSHNNRAIVSAVVGLAQSLGLELVAEGVETEEQRDLLAEMGCEYIQGWLISRALPSDELASSFRTHSLVLHET
ncbi:diguanylate cyclase/phosphodiesterase (GGDEF & EAL domain) with PAS/PAC sensor [Candidatus Burkholderia verschuerenii]|uniref:Diguanylate cyclase/phosphodiesterase (GGDEF & EAL domain) with PAS/PAC sensor n=1 Tax=Candidatus Burkholderia verschuerenii TaxID=242163 RepID=A0A0L0MAI4_9BURK|nr:GGDEF domain-containing protein [Candidatus Burkholderia verschuerenii]KND59301.1 diguanylate cyclase/phosphodiesterase (GGDEF & EAL domain) with PAS/PAC sensor [Candidatus Burkholderia verschuerenii]